MSQHSNRTPRRRPQFAVTTPAERAQWIARYRESGMTQKEFATSHGFSVSALSRWIHETAVPNATTVFQEVPPDAVSAALNEWDAELVLPQNRILRLRGAWARQWVVQWVEGASCSR